MTATQIQGLSRAWNFLLPIPGLSRIIKARGNPVSLTQNGCLDLNISFTLDVAEFKFFNENPELLGVF